MLVTMNRYLSSVSALDYTITNDIERQSRIETIPQNTSTLNGRLLVNNCDDNFPCIRSIWKTVSRFFTDRYADCGMFFRAYIEMGGGTSTRDIQRRITEVTQLITVIENCGDNRNAVRERYRRLSADVRDLFFFNQNYINHFVDCPSGNQEISQEIIRECEQVISFQRQLTSVNTFYRMFSGTTVTTTAVDGTTTNVYTHQPFNWSDWFNGLFRHGFDFRGDNADSVTTTPLSSATTINGINISVPGTVQYVQDAIPADVQNTANEINRLKADWVATRNIPNLYQDPIMLDFMSIPVFDASHTSVQNALRAANAHGATSEATAAFNNRDIFHSLDADSMETHLGSGRSWAPPKCPLCRHPEHGGIDRAYLRIDVDLQNRILQYLRNPSEVSSTTS